MCTTVKPYSADWDSSSVQVELEGRRHRLPAPRVAHCNVVTHMPIVDPTLHSIPKRGIITRNGKSWKSMNKTAHKIYTEPKMS